MRHTTFFSCLRSLPKGLRNLLFYFLLWVVCPKSGMTADSWPEFRGPGAQGISTATNVPVRWSATSNIAWKATVPGKGWSSPVLADGKIYLSTACETEGSPEVSLRVLCLSEADGRTLWNVEAIHPDPSTLKPGHAKNSLASPTPILHGDRLFAHFGHMGTACLSLDGKVLWRQQGLKYSPVHGNGGSPLLVDSELVFSCDGGENPFVAALDANTAYQDNTVVSGNTYYYAATAVDSSGKESALSTPVEAVVP